MFLVLRAREFCVAGASGFLEIFEGPGRIMDTSEWARVLGMILHGTISVSGGSGCFLGVFTGTFRVLYLFYSISEGPQPGYFRRSEELEKLTE